MVFIEKNRPLSAPRLKIVPHLRAFDLSVTLSITCWQPPIVCFSCFSYFFIKFNRFSTFVRAVIQLVPGSWECFPLCIVYRNRKRRPLIWLFMPARSPSLTFSNEMETRLIYDFFFFCYSPFLRMPFCRNEINQRRFGERLNGGEDKRPEEDQK